MKKIIIYILIFVVFSLLDSNLIYSNTGNYGIGNARILGMSNAGNTMFAGYYSSTKNPATLFSKADTNDLIHFSIPNFQLGASSAIQIEHINKYFDGENKVHLSESDKEILISNFDVSDDGLGSIFTNANINPFSVGIFLGKEIGAISISFQEYMSFKASVPKDLAELLFYGNKKEQEFSFNELNVNVVSYGALEFGYAYNIIDSEKGMIRYLNVGAQAKYLMGNVYLNYSMDNTRVFTTNENAIDLDVNARLLVSEPSGLNLRRETSEEEFSFNPMSDIGSGFGLSFGLVAEMDFGLVLGLSMTDIGSINFNKNVEEVLLTKTIKDFNDLSSKEKLDELESDFHDSTLSTSEISMSLPTTLRLGFMAPISKWAGMESELNTYLDLDFGTNEIGTNSNVMKFSLGIDYNYGGYFPRVMTGISNDINGKFRWSGGIGYETFMFDVYLSTYDIISTISPDSHFSAALAMRWKI